eukprot:5412648-Prymnesium_polylepis.2
MATMWLGVVQLESAPHASAQKGGGRALRLGAHMAMMCLDVVHRRAQSGTRPGRCDPSAVTARESAVADEAARACGGRCAGSLAGLHTCARHGGAHRCGESKESVLAG